MAYKNRYLVTVVLIFLGYITIVFSASPGGQPHGIRCYSCDSHFDPDCSKMEHLDQQVTTNCSSFIKDLSPSQLRCVRIISNTDPRQEVVIRRCAVVGDCKYIAKNERQSCHECAHDLCNAGK